MYVRQLNTTAMDNLILEIPVCRKKQPIFS